MSIAVTRAADIVKQMTLGKATMEKLEAIEDNKKVLEAVRNLTKPRMAAIFVMYGKTFRIQTNKETLWLDCIVVLTSSGVLNNGVVV